LKLHNQRFRSNFAGHCTVRVPEVYHDSEDLLVMSLVSGSSLSEVLDDSGGGATALTVDLRTALWEQLGKMVSKMVFEDNFIHQDLHPGNIRVLFSTPKVPVFAHSADIWPVASVLSAIERAASWFYFGRPPPFELHLLDAGLALSLTEEKKLFFVEVMRQAVLGNKEAAGQAFLSLHERLGLAELAVARERFVSITGALASSALTTQRNCWQLLGFKSEEDYVHARLGRYFGRMAQIFAEHQIRMDYEMWSVLTSFALIEGSMYALNGSTNVLRCAAPYVCGPVQLLRTLGVIHKSEGEASIARS